MERRLDPMTNEWRTFGGRRSPDGVESEHCLLCPSTDPEHPTAIPGSGFEIAVLGRDDQDLNTGVPADGPFDELYRATSLSAAIETVVYTDQHDQSLADLPAEHVARLVDVWADRYAVLGARDPVHYVLVLEEHGRTGGPTAEHLHGEVHAYPDIPSLPAAELAAAAAHHRTHGTCVYCDAIAQERADPARVVEINDYFLAFVPFAPRLPYEVHVAPQRHATSLLDLTDPERAALATLLQRVVVRFQARMGPAAPYAMSMHQAPTDDVGWLPLSHLHVELDPGVLLGTSPGDPGVAGSGGGRHVVDLLPEQMAAELRGALAG